MCFVRYDFENTTHEGFMFCKLLTSATAEEIFNFMNAYINENDIEWEKFVGLSSDGARKVSGVCTGFFPRIKAGLCMGVL